MSEQTPTQGTPMIIEKLKTPPEKPLLAPHQDIYINQSRPFEETFLHGHQVDTMTHLIGSNDLLVEMLAAIQPQFNHNISLLRHSTNDVVRVKEKMLVIFTKLRKMRQQLVKAGVVIQGELDLVEEIDKNDKKELEERRKEYLRKRQEKAETLPQQPSPDSNDDSNFPLE